MVAGESRTHDTDPGGDGAGAEALMTVGELSRRTGLSIRAIREYEQLGLIYSEGRSEGGYRLFGEIAVWCADVVQQLRSLGLTLVEIQQLARLHRAGEREALDQRLAQLLEHAAERVEQRIAELTAVRQRIEAARSDQTPRPSRGDVSSDTSRP